MLRLRRAGLALAAACAAAPAIAASAGAAPGWSANEDDALLFETRLGRLRLGEEVRGYQAPSDVCVIIDDVIAALDVPIKVDRAAGTASGWAFDEANRLAVDRKASSVTVKGTRQPLTIDAIHDTPEGWCVSAKLLSNWLGVELAPDLSNAVLVVNATVKLPVELAAERRARAVRVRPSEAFDLAKLPQARLPYQLWRMPSVDTVVTLGGLSDRQRGQRFDRQFELYAAGEVAALSVDARLSSNQSGALDSLRMRAYRSDAAGRLLGPLRATHAAAGDVSSFGSALVSSSLPGRGAIVTNRPIDRPDTFDRKTFRGELPSGWDAEIYRNGQLLGFAQNRSDGRYEFADTPLTFGPNRFEIVLYGPQGQVRRERETVVVGADSISPRETWYWAGVSEDERDLIQLGTTDLLRRRGWRGGFGVERGIDARTSIAASLQTLVLDRERRSYFEGAVRRAIGPALIEVAGAYERGGGRAVRAQLLGQIGETYVSGESILAHRFVSDRIDRGIRQSHKLGLEHSFDLGKLALPVSVEAGYRRRDDGGEALEGRGRVSAGLGRISITGLLDWRRNRLPIGPDPPDVMEASLLANGSIGMTRLRGEVRWRLSPDPGFASAAIVGQRQIGETSDIRAEIGYDRSLGRVRGGLGYVRRFSSFSAAITAEAASDGSVGGGLNLAFSLGPDPATSGLRFTSQKLAATGTALARVFRDTNSDGVRQAGEPFAPEVQIKVNRTPTKNLTGKDGAVLIDRLEPHRPVVIGVDATSLPDPLTQAAGAGVVVVPRPGLPVAIDLALVSAGEVVGTLVDSSGASIEGVDLELVDARGATVASTRSDFDGFFLFESVAYGRYGLRIAALSAQAARLAAPLAATAGVDAATPSVKLGQVTARAATTAQLGLAPPN